tara:strand:- start:61 stop:2313 length:2253 start_codon:yes stop_codon:yes gene_type:complete
MRLRIYHISDVHWTSSTIAPQKLTDYYNAFVSDFKALEFGESMADHTVLVVSGDLPNQYEEGGPPLNQYFQEIEERFLPILTEKFCPSTLIAVPGNHDLDRRSSGAQRFGAFEHCFRDWHTPFTRPFVRLRVGAKSVLFWLINSAQECGIMSRFTCKCGKETISYTDPVKVSQETMDECASQLSDDDDFRIAILHHNPLPQVTHNDSEYKRDVFKDNGDFNEFLIQNGFKIVLSGHYHVGSSIYAAKPFSFTSDGITHNDSEIKPLIESGFYSFGAKSFLRPEYGMNAGFNVVTIELPDESRIANVDLVEYQRYLGETGGRPNRFVPTSTSFRVATKTLEQISNAPSRARKLLELAVSHLYSNMSLGALSRVLDPVSSERHFKALDRKLKSFDGQGKNFIYAAHTVSVLHPEQWWANKLTSLYRRLFAQHLLMASKRAPASQRPKHGGYPLNFQFTTEVDLAIDRSLRAAEELNVLFSVKEALSGNSLTYEEEKFVRDAISAFPDHSSSLSAKSSLSLWDNIVPLDAMSPPREVKENLSCSSGSFSVTREPPKADFDFDFTSGGRSESRSDCLEIVRIALWNREWLDSSYAMSVIKFHEDFGVPFFWLDPTRLKNQQGFLRKNYGLMILYATDEEVNGKIFQTRKPHVSYHDVNGQPLNFQHPLYEERVSGGDYMSGPLWGPGLGPVEYGPRDFGNKEFSLLLRRPDLMFAADAWILTRVGKSNDIDRRVKSMGESIDLWLRGVGPDEAD